MTQIIAGHFEQQQPAQEAMDQLLMAGFSEDKIATFYLNPPGQHDLFPIGGDRDKSPGAEKSTGTLTRGGAAGGAIGGVVGAFGIPVAGIVAPAVGALLGAHIGSLVGSLSGMKEADEEDQDREHPTHHRKAGMMVAVSAEQAPDKDTAISILRSLHADHIEGANGTISNGNWEDFDPLMPPNLIE